MTDGTDNFVWKVFRLEISNIWRHIVQIMDSWICIYLVSFHKWSLDVYRSFFQPLNLFIWGITQSFICNAQYYSLENFVFLVFFALHFYWLNPHVRTLVNDIAESQPSLPWWDRMSSPELANLPIHDWTSSRHASLLRHDGTSSRHGCICHEGMKSHPNVGKSSMTW